MRAFVTAWGNAPHFVSTTKLVVGKSVGGLLTKDILDAIEEVFDEEKEADKMTKKEILEQNMGFKVKASLGDYLLVVENPQGFEEVLHFFENTDGVSMVEGFTFESFNEGELIKMEDDPQGFLADFGKNIANAVPDWEDEAGEWLVY